MTLRMRHVPLLAGKKWRPTQRISIGGDEPAWFQPLRTEMLSRQPMVRTEYMDETIEERLSDTLSPFLPQLARHRVVHLGHHLVWFNASLPPDQLLPDGTDWLHCPGRPWTRRMWAGGSLQMQPRGYLGGKTGFLLGSSMVCAEHIKDVKLRGHGDAAKLFVDIERRFARLGILRANMPTRQEGPTVTENGPARLRRYFADQLDSEEWGDSILRERRTLVFLKDKTPAELEAIKSGEPMAIKYMDPPTSPLFSHALVPNRALLFNVSALTYNAHLIHVDRGYAQQVEGHRNLLVHGPLTVTLMLQAMSNFLKTSTDARYMVESIDYRNLAPLYCDEQMRVCGARKKASSSQDTFDVWIEGPGGGVAVKGTVRAVRMPTEEQNRVQKGPNQAETASNTPTNEAVSTTANSESPPLRDSRTVARRVRVERPAHLPLIRKFIGIDYDREIDDPLGQDHMSLQAGVKGPRIYKHIAREDEPKLDDPLGQDGVFSKERANGFRIHKQFVREDEYNIKDPIPDNRGSSEKVVSSARTKPKRKGYGKEK